MDKTCFLCAQKLAGPRVQSIASWEWGHRLELHLSKVVGSFWWKDMYGDRKHLRDATRVYIPHEISSHISKKKYISQNSCDYLFAWCDIFHDFVPYAKFFQNKLFQKII